MMIADASFGVEMKVGNHLCKLPSFTGSPLPIRVRARTRAFLPVGAHF